MRVRKILHLRTRKVQARVAVVALGEMIEQSEEAVVAVRTVVGRGGRGGDRGRGRRSGRGGRRGAAAQAPDDGIESLLNLEIVPTEPVPPRPEVEGDLSPRARKALEVAQHLMKLGSLELTSHVVQDDDAEIHIDLRGKDEATAIGPKGDALLALQFIVNRIVGRDAEEGQVVVLDAAGYRGRRKDALADLATKLADRALEEGKVVRLSPMSAHDRRVFHLTLKEIEGVETRSEGDGLYRNLLIIPSQFSD